MRKQGNVQHFMHWLIYQLSQNQIDTLKQWELDAEIDNVLPVIENLQYLEKLIDDDEHVVLISDMYLPENIIRKMLRKVCPRLDTVPLFLSSTRRFQKTTQKLYLDVYHSFSPYSFKEWHHYGDNKIADGDRAKDLNIIPHIHAAPAFNVFEQAIVNHARDYDSYLFAGMLARFRVQQQMKEKEYFAFAHAGCYFIPYISWVVRDALSHGFTTLYFISRDGYFLKKVADAYIRFHSLSIKTKYIYGSRQAWRIPAQIDRIDDEFFTGFGSLVGVDSYEKLLLALDMPHHIFQRLFGELGFSKSTTFSPKELSALRAYLKSSHAFHQYLLQTSAKKRKIVIQYILQEIDFSERFAFVEFWGRGYTQTSFRVLLDAATQNESKYHFYYYRSILPSQESDIRKNFSTNNTSLLFIEAIFANNPFSTVSGYRVNKNTIVPVMNKNNFDIELFHFMEVFLPVFVQELYSLQFYKTIEAVERTCSDFSLYWFRDHQDDPVLVKSVGHLLDSVELWGTVREFAPAFSTATLNLLQQGVPVTSLTRSLKMSLARSTPEIRKAYQAILKNVKKPSAQAKKVHLGAKLREKPDAFYADARKRWVQLVGKVCLSKPFRSSLGRGLIYLTKKIYGY